jgi:hypothetical protein
MNNELEGIWNEAVVTLFRVLSWYLPRGTAEFHEKPQSGCPVSEPRFEPGTYRIEAEC